MNICRGIGMTPFEKLDLGGMTTKNILAYKRKWIGMLHKMRNGSVEEEKEAALILKTLRDVLRNREHVPRKKVIKRK